jgi:LmbE family N-acetylglucosaminyl deacetylase
MKRLLLVPALLMALPCLFAQSPLRIIVIGAHPDDPDHSAGGTAALFASMGHAVKFLAVTNGDAGHHIMGGGPLAKRRTGEAQEAGKRLGVVYEVLDNHDGELEPTLAIRKVIIRKIREWNADIVISHRTNDYHPDHRYTGVLVQDAAFMVGVPNIAADTPPLRKTPLFLYSQDHFQRPNPFRPDIAVDISSVFSKKVDAVDAHFSQMYEWGPWIDRYEGDVPKSEADRKKWLADNLKRTLTPEIRKSLEKWYGAAAAAKVQHAESFEVCEYGRQPSEEEIRALFPMLKK